MRSARSSGHLQFELVDAMPSGGALPGVPPVGHRSGVLAVVVARKRIEVGFPLFKCKAAGYSGVRASERLPPKRLPEPFHAVVAHGFHTRWWSHRLLTTTIFPSEVRQTHPEDST